MNLTKEELIETMLGCREGNRKSQETLFKHFYGKMMTVCLRYARYEDEAKDMLQEGFIKVFNHIQKYKVEGSVEGWIRRIIVNTAIDHYRKNKKIFQFEDESRIKDEDQLVDGSESNENYNGLKGADILEAMKELSPAYRAVFNLYAVENYTHKEIAEILDISIGTSKSNYAKAKAKLKKILEKKTILT